ncbi:MAG: HAD family hydrolase [Sphingobium sp.]|nr:HAD family hydrolase [Sphingobium sp.]
MTISPTNRPLLITDCDEVLLHMVVPFREWLDEVHDVHFSFEDQNFVNALRRKGCGTVLEQGEVWDLLRDFFLTEMGRQGPIEGALEALSSLSDIADIVILTNIGEELHQLRVDQLANVGVHHRVYWNQGGKGAPLRRIVEERQPSVALFVDDLGAHHESVANHAGDVWRLHMVGEPEIAVNIAPSPHAHARIDSWKEAEAWIRARFAEGPAPLAVGPVLGEEAAQP